MAARTEADTTEPLAERDVIANTPLAELGEWLAAHQPTRDDRLSLALIALRSAKAALRAEPPDRGAARVFLDDAMLQVRAARLGDTGDRR